MRNLYTIIFLFIFSICNSQTTNLFDHLTDEDAGGLWEVCQQPTGASVVFDPITGILQNSSLVCIAGDGDYCLRYVLDCPECPGLRDTSEVWLKKCCLEVVCFEDAPISCQGGANGAIGVTETYGDAPFTYLWSDAQTTDPATGLSAGTYTVTVTDNSGCTATCEFTLDDSTAPVILTIEASPDEVICAGETITLSTNITTGTAPFTHAWSTTETTATIDVTTSGTYSVTVTDTDGCTGTDEITITDGASDTPVCETQVNSDPFVDGCTVEICEGDGTNDIILSPNGTGSSIAGTSTYLWSTGSNLSSITLTNVLAADSGTYSLTVTSTDGCTATLDFTVTVLDEIAVACTPTNTTCAEANDGSVTTVVSSGTGPYTYVWSNAATTSSITGLSAGTYTVTVTDANGCTGTCQGVVADGAGITATIAGTLSFCTGSSTTLTASSDGTPPETYVWSTTETTAAINVNTAGTYSVTVTDANGCTDDSSVVVAENTLPVLVCRTRIVPPGTWLDGVCDAAFCEGDGTTDVRFRPNATGSSIPVGSTYLWSNGSTSVTLVLNDVTSASSGTYTVTVTDPNGCTATQDFTLDVYDQPEVACTATDETCAGDNDGSVTTVVTGGTAPFTYVWSNGATTSDITGLSANTYTVTVTDANGCTSVCEGIVAAGPNVIAQILGGGDYCDGDNVLLEGDGFNGSTPYTWLWSTAETTQDITVTTAGTYCLTVTDANGCTDDQCVPVTFNPNPTLVCQYNLDAAGFVDGCTIQICEEDGTRDVILSPAGTGSSIPGGSTYSWTGGTTGSSLTLLNVTPANSGTYTVTVTEPIFGCDSEITFTLDVYDQPDITCTATDTNCSGANDGSVTTTVTGGTGPYTYNWSTAATTSSITGLGPSTYTVTVTDANGCTDTCSGVVNEGVDIVASIAGTLEICDGDNTTLTASSSTTALPETYVWSTTETTASINVTTAGVYTVTVTDASGCTDEESVTVTVHPLPVLACAYYIDAVPFIDGCNIEVCEDDGTHDIGMSPYGTGSNIPVGSTFSWSAGTTPSNGSTTEIQNATAADSGVYTVTVTSPEGCVSTLDFNVTIHPAIDIACTGSATSCPGVSDGTVTTVVTGGTPAFTYAWSNGQTTANATGLAPGTYTVTVTDSEGCTATCSGTVTEGTGLNVVFTGSLEYCASDLTTNVTGSTTNGTAPFSFNWSTGATTATVALNAGTYTLTVTDNIGCTGTADVTITENPDPTITCTGFDGQCGALGNVSTIIMGGTAPYTFLWNTGATTQNLFGVPDGTYSVTVTDANGCTDSCSDSVTNEPDVSVSCSGTNMDCFGDNNGTATATVSGGTAPFTYSWSNGGSTATITNLPSGTYTVTVTDANGCNDVCSYTVTSPTDLTVTTSCS